MPLARTTQERRKLRTEFEKLANKGQRYVDLGIELRVVERDETARYRIPEFSGTYRITDKIHRGGMFDTLFRRYVGPSKDPIIWHCGPEQLPVILHDYPQTSLLVYGAEGAGKSELLAMWTILQALKPENFGRDAGALAPTWDRVETVVGKVLDKTRESWGNYYAGDHDYVMVTGVKIQFRSVERRRKGRSPIQGYTWAFAASDEIQDYEKGIDADIEARGRGAIHKYRRVNTATAADTNAWRTFRDRKMESPDWLKITLDYTTNPFTSPEHWQRVRRNMTQREYERRMLALDVAPEFAVYPDYDQLVHHVPDPRPFAEDVTRDIVGRDVLIGHDPGQLWNVSLMLKAFLLEGEELPRWYVIDEISTRGADVDRHIVALTKALKKIRLTPAQTLVRADPYTDKGGDSVKRPDVSVYKSFRKAGYRILAAGYDSKNANPKPIPKEAGILTVNTLLRNVENEVRLHIFADNGAPVAPKLANALRSQERDAKGEAETDRKDENDTSHWVAALRYALYAYEKVRVNNPAWQRRVSA